MIGPPSSLARVTSEEHELLTLVRALFEPQQHAMVGPLLRTARILRPAIGRTSMSVLQDTLAKGLVRMLARDLAPSLPKAPTLHLSPGTFRMLHWLLQAPLAAKVVPPLADDGAPQTFADQVIVALALDLAESAAVSSAFAAQSWVRRAPLACLYATHELPFAPALDLEHVALLPRTLAARLVVVEQAKARVPSPDVRAQIGRAQGALLAPLVARALAERRWDALRFLLESPFLQVRPGPFDATSALSARAEALRQQVAPHRAIAAIAAIHRRARLTGFVDDDYDQAQSTLRALAPWEDVFAAAETRVRAAEELEDLR